MTFTAYRADSLALHESILLRQPAQTGWLVRSPGQPRGCCTRASASAEPYELRVCTNKTCKKQGSQQVFAPVLGGKADPAFQRYQRRLALPLLSQVLKFAQDLQLDEVKVKEVGCLGEPADIRPSSLAVYPWLLELAGLTLSTFLADFSLNSPLAYVR